MAYLVDSHCHIDQLEELDLAMQRAAENNIQHLLCPCITLKDFPQMLAITKKYSHVSASVGLHPNDDPGSLEATTEYLVTLGQDPKVVGIGETGLDYYRTEPDMSWQTDRFRHHIRAAIALKKPLIIHSRQAPDDTISILKEENAASIGGVLHCFTENWEMAKAALDLNFYISFSGILTFKNAVEIQAVAKKVPEDRILIETDAPYLAPNPHRGKPNEPAYVKYVAEHLAALRGVSFETIAELTANNFFRLFTGAHNHV